MYINLNSDFNFVLHLRDAQGTDIGFPTVPFDVVLYTGLRLNDCKPKIVNDGGFIHVYADNPELAPGGVIAEVTLHYPDPLHPDGERSETIEIATDIEITDSVDTPQEFTGDVEASLAALYRSAYDDAVAAGYTGTKAEYMDFASQLPSKVEVAQEAAGLAESAAAAAVGAANDAASAAASCRAEAEAAGRAATEASTAALAADTAAGRASDAATAAEGAAATANTAAANADAAKGRADAAATAADAAKERADDAASAATIAANGAAAVVGQVEAAVEGINQYDDRIAEAEEEAERLVRDLAQYEAEEAISLAVGTSGKVVNTAGALVARSGFAVSQPMRLRKGYTYLYRPLNSQPLPEGVALCARLVTTDTPVVIDYVYEYDDMARPIVATAQHSGARYTIEYDAQGQAVTYAPEGAMVQGLPQYRIAQANTYVPMFVSLSQTMPRSGYYAVLCNEDCMAVWSAALVGGVLGSVEVTSYGFVRSLVNQKEDKAVVKQLQERVGEIGAVVSRLEAAEFAALPMELEHTTYDMQVIEGRHTYNASPITADANYNLAAIRLEPGLYYIDYLANWQYSGTPTFAVVADCEDIDARLAVGQSVDGVLEAPPAGASNDPTSVLLRVVLTAPMWVVYTSRSVNNQRTPPRFDVYRLAEARPSMNAATRLADECSLAAAAVQLQPGQALMKIRRGRAYKDVKASAAHDTWAVVPYAPGGSVGSPDVLAIAAINLGNYNNSVCQGFQNCEYLDPRGLFGFASAGMSNAFANCMTLRELDLTGLDMSRTTTPTSMFSNCLSLQRIYGIEHFDMGAVTSLNSMFSGCAALERLDLSGWDTSALTDVQAIFSGCASLREVITTGWDTSHVTTLQQVFYNCPSLERLNLSHWDTSAVTTLSSAFYLDKSLVELNIANWDVRAVTDMDGMVRQCVKLEALDLSGWHTPALTNANNMFASCWELKTLDIRNFDLHGCTTTNMFTGCNELHYVTVGAGVFGAATIDFSPCSVLGREGSTTNSNGWLEHFAATAPQITDGQARTIKLHSAIKGYAWAIPYINQLTSKGYSIA